MRVGPSWKGLVPLEEEKGSLHNCVPRKGHMRTAKQEKALTKNQICQLLILDFPASGTMRNKCLLF
ncbi:unnamed protein product, partial [Gulo gulo]